MLPYLPFETVLWPRASAESLEPPPSALPEDTAWALFLDLDGTLCPLRDDPAEVALDHAQRVMLTSLSHRVDGALCILSGRERADLDRALGDVPIASAAEHGREMSPPPSLEACGEMHHVHDAMRTIAGRFERHGVWLERKRASCALHYRQAPWLEGELVAEMRALARSSSRTRLMEGRCVLEVVAGTTSKGRALRSFMDEAPFRGRKPIAVGDDVTDEDAFVAAASLGGFGVAVGPRPSAAARHGLRDTSAVNAWLGALAGDSGGAPHGDV